MDMSFATIFIFYAMGIMKFSIPIIFLCWFISIFLNMLPIYKAR